VSSNIRIPVIHRIKPEFLSNHWIWRKVHETSSKMIGTIHCQGGHVAKGHRFADSKSEEVKEKFVRIHESQ
jgi:hypothetical protein